MTGHTGAVSLAEVNPELVTWLWPGRLPIGKLVMIDGDPSTGKSTLTLDIAARVSTGACWPDGTPNISPGGVLLLSAEDGLADTIVPRLIAAGADLSRCTALVDVANPDGAGEIQRVPPMLPRDIPIIEQLVRERGIRLIIVDVLMAYLGSADSHKDQDIRAVLHRLAMMAESTGCTIILVRHLNKAGGSNALYRGGGSIGIVGASRAGFIVARDPEDNDRRLFAFSKVNVAIEPPTLAYRLESVDELGCARIVWEPDPVDLSAADLLRAPLDGDERTERDDAATWLRDYLAAVGGTDRSAAVKKAAAAADISLPTLQRARQRVGLVVSTQTEPGRSAGSITRTTWWSLAEAVVPPTPDTVGVKRPALDETTGADLRKQDGLGETTDPFLSWGETTGETTGLTCENNLSEGVSEPVVSPGLCVAPPDAGKSCGHPGKSTPNGRCAACVAEARGWSA